LEEERVNSNHQRVDIRTASPLSRGEEEKTGVHSLLRGGGGSSISGGREKEKGISPISIVSEGGAAVAYYSRIRKYPTGRKKGGGGDHSGGAIREEILALLVTARAQKGRGGRRQGIASLVEVMQAGGETRVSARPCNRCAEEEERGGATNQFRYF